MQLWNQVTQPAFCHGTLILERDCFAMSRCFNSNCFCDTIGSNYIRIHRALYIYMYIQINLSYMFGQFGPICDLINPPSPASGLIAAIIMNIMIIMMTTCVFLLMETNMCHFHKLGHLYVLMDVVFCLKYSAKVDASGSFIPFYTVHSSIILGSIFLGSLTQTIPTIPTRPCNNDRCFPTPWLFAGKVICGTLQVTTSMIAMDFLAWVSLRSWTKKLKGFHSLRLVMKNVPVEKKRVDLVAR